MPLPITDDHRALAEVARSFLAGQRAAARALLDAARRAACPRRGRRSPGSAGSGCTCPRSTAARARAFPSSPWCWRSWAGWSRRGRSCPPCWRRRSSSRRGRRSSGRAAAGLADGSQDRRGRPRGRRGGRAGARRPRARRRARRRRAARGRRRRAGQRAVRRPPSTGGVLDPTRRAATVVADDVGHPDPRRGGRRATARPHPGRRRGRGHRRARAWTWPSPTSSSASSSAARSARSRPSSTTAPTCCSTPSWPPRPRGTPSAPRPGTPAAELAAAVAAARAVPAGVRAAEMAIQLHGGIGFTWEHDCHLYLRRAVTLAAFVDRAGDAVRDAARLVRPRAWPAPPTSTCRRRPSGTGPRCGRSSPRSTAWTPTARRARLVESRLPRAALAAAVGPRRVRRRAARHRAGAARRRTCRTSASPAGTSRRSPSTARRAGRALGRPDAARRDHVVPAVLRARRRVGRRRDRDPRRARRRRVAGHRAEGVDHRRAPVGLGLRHRAHRPVGAQARGRHDDGDRPAQPRASRCGRCASSPARRCSTRSSSTTCSCPTTAWSARSGRAGGSRGPRWATSACRSAAAARACCRCARRTCCPLAAAAPDPHVAEREVAALVVDELALRLMLLRQAARAVGGIEPGPEGNLSKLFSSEHAQRLTGPRGAARGRARPSPGVTS